MVRKTVWVDPALWKRARIAALEKNEPLCALLERALKKEIEEYGQKHKNTKKALSPNLPST